MHSKIPEASCYASSVDPGRYYDERSAAVIDALRDLLHEERVSFAEAERRLDWSRERISRVFAGRQNLTFRFVFDILEVVGVSHQAFFSRLVFDREGAVTDPSASRFLEAAIDRYFANPRNLERLVERKVEEALGPEEKGERSGVSSDS